MRNLVVAVVCMGSTAVAAPSARVDKTSARRSLLAARAECKKPNKRIESLIARYFDPGRFGSDVIMGWSQLTNEQRADFEREADRVVGGKQRATALAQICKRRVTIDRPWMNDDDIVRIKMSDLEDGTNSVTLALQPDGSQWRLVAIRSYGVPNFHRAWRFRFDPSTDASDRLADYEKAMEYLRAH